MILYNVTIIIDESIEELWLDWMKNIHIQEVMDTGCFASNRMLKVLDSPNEGITYCIQYIADSIEKYNEYKLEFANALQADFPENFTDKFVSFRTLMEFVDAR